MTKDCEIFKLEPDPAHLFTAYKHFDRALIPPSARTGRPTLEKPGTGKKRPPAGAGFRAEPRLFQEASWLATVRLAASRRRGFLENLRGNEKSRKLKNALVHVFAHNCGRIEKCLKY
jgi:hypothetical protein